MKDDLFRLVKSLVAREVGIMNKHFKDNNGRQAQLFDRLRRQKHYNGECLKIGLFRMEEVPNEFAVIISLYG